MTIHYSVESLGSLFLSDEYITDKNEYIQSKLSIIDNLNTFLNSIEINKNYYRTGIHVKNPRYKKKVSDDTLIIKEFKASLNKMSSINYEKLCSKLTNNLNTKKHLYPLMIQYIIEQSLLHHTYIKYYVELVDRLNSYFKDASVLVLQLDDCYHKITTSNLDTSSEYSNLCSKNKQIDQLVGYSIFISELELRNIINGRIDVSIQSILDTMKKELSEDEMYKCVRCLQQIFKVLYSDSPIKQEYINDLTEIKDKLKFMKIKFKIMDILEKR